MIAGRLSTCTAVSANRGGRKCAVVRERPVILQRFGGLSIALPHVMDENALLERLNALDARVAEMRQLILAVEKVEKIVLTEVRGLGTKVDRLTRPRGRPLIPNP
jgi:hypothetical protein